MLAGMVSEGAEDARYAARQQRKGRGQTQGGGGGGADPLMALLMGICAC